MILAMAAVACAAAAAAEEASALKASGTSTPRYGQATAGIVCGDRLCSDAPRPEPAEAPGSEDARAAGPHSHAASADADFVELAPGVYSYFLNGYNSLVVVSEDGVLITDPADDARAAALKGALAELTDAPVTWIAMSHEHYDHVGGTSVFPGAQIACHLNCQAIFDLDPTGSAPESVDLVFSDYESIQMGDIAVEMHYLGPGDGDATAVIYLPREQVAFTSDLYEPRELTHGMFLDDSNSTGRQHILNTMSGWPLTHAITSHSDNTDPASLYENARFLNDLRAAVEEAVGNSETGGFGAVVELYMDPSPVRLPQYSDWDGYEEHIDRHVQRMVMSLYHGD